MTLTSQLGDRNTRLPLCSTSSSPIPRDTTGHACKITRSNRHCHHNNISCSLFNASHFMWIPGDYFLKARTSAQAAVCLLYTADDSFRDIGDAECNADNDLHIHEQWPAHTRTMTCTYTNNGLHLHDWCLHIHEQLLDHAKQRLHNICTNNDLHIRTYNKITYDIIMCMRQYLHISVAHFGTNLQSVSFS